MRYLLATLPLLLGACSTIGDGAASVPSRAGAAEASGSPSSLPGQSASQRLAALLAAAEKASIRSSPLDAMARGDPSYDGRFGDNLKDEYIAAEKRRAEEERAALRSIPRSRLTVEEQLTYDVFEWQLETRLLGYAPAVLAATILRPIDQQNGYHIQLADHNSGQGLAPYKTVRDYELSIRRTDDFIAYLDRAIARMRQGVKAGIVQPRIVMEKVVKQLDDFIALGVEGSPYYGPIRKFPDQFSPADRERLTEAYRTQIRDRLIPAHARLRDYVRDEYLPHARETIGLYAMPGGAELYRQRIRSYTTTDMTPDEIHKLGLAEVARIQAQMEAVKRKVGFQGTLQQFAAALREDPRFKPKSAEALRQLYTDIGARVDTRLSTLFETLPKTRLEIRPFPDYRAGSAVNAMYIQGTPDGSRPGVFHFNASKLESRSTLGSESLYLHEGVPGHHFQISLAQENTRLPALLRYGGNTAFGEGWALYAETLGPDLGLFTDPYQVYGHLGGQLFRAARLVVDTGIHAKGWSRARAIQYMLDTTPDSEASITVEIDRYIAMPAQALAYKIGERTISRLRAEAERELGPKFDLREFHSQVLMTGALPMKVLEGKIRRWIAARKAG